MHTRNQRRMLRRLCLVKSHIPVGARTGSFKARARQGASAGGASASCTQVMSCCRLHLPPSNRVPTGRSRDPEHGRTPWSASDSMLASTHSPNGFGLGFTVRLPKKESAVLRHTQGHVPAACKLPSTSSGLLLLVLTSNVHHIYITAHIYPLSVPSCPNAQSAYQSPVTPSSSSPSIDANRPSDRALPRKIGFSDRDDPAPRPGHLLFPFRPPLAFRFFFDFFHFAAPPLAIFSPTLGPMAVVRGRTGVALLYLSAHHTFAHSFFSCQHTHTPTFSRTRTRTHTRLHRLPTVWR
ncbi:hypothetical protein DM02DRAFT_63401 [Periconia macrospinosa]|uniref:Uncharacterized protein n=1 Tax=Periconia macrospinosa TaxID=97972 RepID=A0A2V1DKX8_9PLEO|nr:hypothetical protein DM02DRAFT_63401 [Periconia macrospinosa]